MTDHPAAEDHDPVVVQIDAEALDNFVLAQRRTVKSLVRFIVVATLVVSLFVGGLVGWLVSRSFSSQDRTECITKAQAIALGELVAGLKGQPATAARNEKLDRAAAHLSRLQDVGNLCG